MFLMMSLFFILGACIGSFLNVCIHRLPLGQSVISPRSFCPNCKGSIPWYHNVPIISFLILRGKAACCGSSIPQRHLWVELLSAVFFVFNFKYYPLPLALINTIFLSCLIVASGIDLDYMYIPDRLTLGGLSGALVLALATPFLGKHYVPLSPLLGSFYAFVGALASASFGAGLLLLISFLAEKLLGQEAIGMGDIKLMAFIGAFCSWQGALFALFVGSMLGSAILLPIICFQKIRGVKPHGHKQWQVQCSLDPALDSLDKNRLRVPFGPWLSLAASIYVLFFKLKISPGTFLY